MPFRKTQAHVAGGRTHILRASVVVHEIPGEPFDRGRVPAGGHVGRVVFHQVGDHGDAVVAFAAGLVDLSGERAGGQVAGHLHGPRLEQEREPAAGPGPRGGHRPHPVHGTGDAGQSGVDERLVLEEVRMPPHAFPRVMHRVGVLPAARPGAMEVHRARNRSRCAAPDGRLPRP